MVLLTGKIVDFWDCFKCNFLGVHRFSPICFSFGLDAVSSILIKMVIWGSLLRPGFLEVQQSIILIGARGKQKT